MLEEKKEKNEKLTHLDDKRILAIDPNTGAGLSAFKTELNQIKE